MPPSTTEALRAANRPLRASARENRMKKLLMLAAATVLATAAAVQASAETIRFAITSEPYAPFTYKNAAGKWQGFEIDFINALCAHIKGAKCSLVEQAWDGLIPALQARKFDAIVASMTITPEREKVIAFSLPYYLTPAAIIGPKDQKFSADPATLKGKTIGVQTGTTHADYAEKVLGNSITLKRYGTIDEADSDLAAGRLDAVIADGPILDEFLKTDAAKNVELKGVFPKDDPIWGPGMGVGMRKGDTKLRTEINDAIRAIYKDGTFAKLEKPYFTYDIGTPPKD
jgi:polar amino acid transport system substrate-binding protein